MRENNRRLPSRRMRALEAITIASTTAAFAITVLLVTTGRAVEVNPFAAGLLDAFGWTAVGISAVVVEAAAFAFFERVCNRDDIDRRPAELVALAGGGVLATLGVLDVFYNIYLLTLLDDVGSFYTARYAPAVAIVLVAGIVAFIRPIPQSLSTRLSVTRKTGIQALTLLLCVFMITSALPVGSFSILGGSPIGEARAADGSFSSVQSMPHALTDMGSAVTDNYVYSLGGYDGDESSLVYRYDPVADSWTQLSSMSKRRDAAGASINGTVYAIGGYNAGVVATVQEYDPSTGNWTTLSPLPTARRGAAAVAYGGKIYVFGGNDGNGNVAKLSIYDPSADSWSTGTSIPSAIRHVTAAEINGEIYVRGDGGNEYVYDVSSDSWSSYASHPNSPQSGRMVSHDEKLWYAGGNTGAGTTELTDVHSYDPATNSWSVEPSLSKERADHGGAVINNQIIFYGGFDANSYELTSVESMSVDPTSIVSGTVTDSDGNSLTDATVTTNTSKSATADPAGQYSLSLSNGTYEVTANKSGYDPVTKTVTVSGSDKTVNFSLPSSKTIDGRVETMQDGTGVANATVRITTVNTSAISATDPIQEGKDRITNASAVTPSTWDKSLDLRSEKFATDSRYVAVTQKSLHDRPFILDTGDVSDPQLQVPAGEELVLTVWDGSARPSIFDDEYESQLPGEPVDDGTVVIEKLSVTGEVVDKQTNSTDKTVGGGFLDPSEMSYASISGLNPGYYRVSAESSDVSYVIQVGSPTEVFDSGLEDINSSLTERSAWARDQIQNGPMATQNVPTNETGHFNATLHPSAEVVGVQAYKASSLDVPEENLTLEDIRANSSELTGSIYLPSHVYTVEPPKSGMTVQMYEAKYPQFGNVSDYQSQLKDLLDRLRNGSFSDLPPAFQEALDNVSDQRLKDTNEKLDRLSRENNRLRDRFHQEADDRNVNVSVSIDDANRTQLNNRMAAMQEAITSLESTVDTELVDEGSGAGETTISRTWEVGDRRTDIDPSGTAVRIDYSNGTTKYLNATDSDYVTVNNRAFQPDTVAVTEYPLGDASAAEVSVIVATSDGIGKASDSVTNPALSGNVPQLRAIDASTLVPETGEQVSMTARPQEGTGFKSVTGATVYGPDGTTVTSSLSGDTLDFTPTQTGAHRVKLTFSNLDGDRFTEVVRLNAVENGQDRPASVRAVSGPTGTYALVGGPLQSGEIDVQDGGSTLDVTAVADSADDATEVHVYTEGLSLAPDHITTVSVVEGDDEKRIGRNARVVMHAPAFPDDAYVYRVEDGDKEPLPEGKSPAGILRSGDENTTIQTYTDTNGGVGIRTIASPGILEKAEWLIQTRFPDVSLPGMAFAPVQPSTAPGGS